MYIAIATPDLSVQSVQFTPRNQILSHESQYQLPLFNHTLAFPVRAAATNDLFYILANDAILVFQNAPSSYDMLYATLPLDFQPKTLSAVAQSKFDAILVVGNATTLNRGLHA